MSERWNTGAGDVQGPASSADSNVVLFDGTDGKTIKDSGVSGSLVVIKSQNLSDNAIPRGDGGTQTVQNSSCYIDDSNNLGVGTSSPNSSGFGAGSRVLEVKSEESNDIAVCSLYGHNNTGTGTFVFFEFKNAASSVSVDRVADFRALSDGDVDYAKIAFYTNGSSGYAQRMVIDSDGAVQMNNYGAGTATFDASGNITSVSDLNFKEDITPFEKGLDAVLKLKACEYMWKEDTGLDRSQKYTGFIAQEVEEVIPEAVSKNAKGERSLSDRAIIAALVNAVKELKAEIEELKK